jgi:hypothetical protein
MQGTTFFSASQQSKPGLKTRLQSPRGGYDRTSSQLSLEKFVRPPVGERCRRGIVVRSIMPGEGVTLPRIAIDRRVCFAGKCCLDLSLRRLADKLVLLPRCISRGA